MSAKHDCTKQFTVQKAAVTGRPNCHHGPMRDATKSWVCKDRHQFTKTENRKTKKGRMGRRDEAMNRWVKANEARIEANEATLSTLLGGMFSQRPTEGDG